MEKEEAMKILRELHDKALFSERTALETFVPELKESEDEMIRKEIIKYIKTGTYHKSWIDWLEKQGDTLEVKEKNEAIKSNDLEEAAWTY